MSRTDRTLLEIAQAASRAQRGSLPFRHAWERDRYSIPWLCTRPTEAAVQAQILGHLAREGVRAFPVDAGAKALRGRAIGALRRGGLEAAEHFVNRGRTGAAAFGVSDIVGVLPGGRALFLEVKQPEWLAPRKPNPNPKVINAAAFVQTRAAGAATPAQLQFLLEMHDQGALVSVVWDLSDVLALLAVPPSPSRP